jgi:RNA polymerase-binding transcription factor DksA
VDANRIDLDGARAKLGSEREQLERTLQALREEMAADGPISESGDAAADTASAQRQLELRSELDTQLAEVDAALGRLDGGTYGIDEVTGEPIDPARLEAIPTARTNI